MAQKNLAEWFRVMRPIGAWVPWELRDLVRLEERADEPECESRNATSVNASS